MQLRYQRSSAILRTPDERHHYVPSQWTVLLSGLVHLSTDGPDAMCLHSQPSGLKGACIAHLRVAPTAGAHPVHVPCGDLVWISRMKMRQLRCRDAHRTIRTAAARPLA